MSHMPKFAALMRDVRAASITKDPDIHNRILAAAPATSGSEAVGADGGFSVPPDVAKAIVVNIRANTIAGRCTNLPATGNNVAVPHDEIPPWAAAAATGVYWEAELAAIAESKPALTAHNYRLNKLTALIPCSDEVLEDSQLFDAWCRTAIPARIGARLTTGIIRGTGAGQLRGILNDPALISVTRGMSVTATAATMWKRLYGSGRGNAVWLVNPDVDVPSTPGLPLALHGAPVLAVEACSAAGAAGDIILCDLSQYTLLTKALKTDVSMHFYFDANTSAYRFILRAAGQGAWSAAATPENGSTTLSWAVTAAA